MYTFKVRRKESIKKRIVDTIKYGDIIVITISRESFVSSFGCGGCRGISANVMLKQTTYLLLLFQNARGTRFFYTALNNKNNKMSETSLLKFKASSFRRLATPYDDQGKKDYMAVVNMKDIPAELDNWRELNVRDPKESKSVPKEIKQSLIDDPEGFYFKNRGLLILADKVHYDNSRDLVELEFVNKAMNGLADGGHSFRVIRRHIEGLSPEELEKLDAYVKVEILEGFTTREEVVPIIEARNNSTAVLEQSFQELLGAYNTVKEQLRDKSYADRIYYKQFEESADGETIKDIDIKEILSYLICFDTENFNDQVHPIKAYSAISKVVDHFAIDAKNPEKKERLDRLVVLLPDILRLRDIIYKEMPLSYNAIGGKFGGLTDVVPIKKGMKEEELVFIGEKSGYRIPSGFIYPVLASMRVLVENKKGVFSWRQDPVDFFLEIKEELISALIGQEKSIQNPNQLGKDGMTWLLCYKIAENAALRKGWM